MKLNNQFFLVGFSEFFSKALAWLTLAIIPIFSAPEIYGKIVLYYSIIIFLIPLFLFGQDRLILRNDANLEINRSLVFSFFILLFLSPFLIYFNYFLLALVGFILALNKIYLTYLRSAEKIKSYACNRIIYSSLRFFVVIIVIYFFYTDSNYIFAEFAAGLMATIYMLIMVFKNGISFDVEWKERFFHGFPLMLHGLSIFGIALIDRFILQYFTDLKTVGNYSFLYIFASGLIFLYSIIGIVMEKKIYKSNNNMELFKNIKSTFIYMFILGLFGSIVSVILYVIITNFNIVNGYAYLPGELLLLLLAHLFLPIYLVSNYFLIQKGKNNLLMYSTFLSLLVNFLTNIIFIPLYGLIGAVYATLLSNLILCSIISFISYNVFKVSDESR